MKNIITYHLVDKDYYPVMAVVGEDLCRNIVRGLQDVYTAQYIVRSDYDLGGNFLNISFYLDIPTKLIYLYYQLDFGRTASVRAYDTEIYNRIYDWIRYTVRDYKINVQLVGEYADKVKNNRGRNNPYIHHTNQMLRPSTRALWYVSPQGKLRPHFIENRMLFQDDIRLSRMDVSTQREFYHKVEELNSHYNLPGNELEDMPAAFEEFNLLYQEYFGKTLPIFLPQKTFDIHIDITHDVEEERLDPEFHDGGFFVNPSLISKLILKKSEEN